MARQTASTARATGVPSSVWLVPSTKILIAGSLASLDIPKMISTTSFASAHRVVPLEGAPQPQKSWTTTRTSKVATSKQVFKGPGHSVVFYMHQQIRSQLAPQNGTKHVATIRTSYQSSTYLVHSTLLWNVRSFTALASASRISSTWSLLVHAHAMLSVARRLRLQRQLQSHLSHHLGLLPLL